MDSLKVVKRIYSVMAVCLIVVGAMLLIKPDMSINIICKATGIVLIGYGIVKFAGYAAKDLFQLAFQFDLALGIVSIVFGIALVFKTQHVVEILSTCIGVFMLVDATLKIQTSIDSKRFGMERWWLILIAAIAVAAVGVLLIIKPFSTTSVIIRIIGLTFCLDGVMNLIVVQSTVKTIRRNKEWEL